MEDKAYQSFIGSGWSFPPEFNQQSGTVKMTSDEADIEASLRIMLGTSQGERFFRPKYGLNLQEMLFEPLNTTNRTLLIDRIKINILIYEPRIKLEALEIDTRFLTEGKVQVLLEYTIRASNSRFNLVYPYFINDGNEVSDALGFQSVL